MGGSPILTPGGGMKRFLHFFYKSPPKLPNPGKTISPADFYHLVERVARLEGKQVIMGALIIAIAVGVFALVSAQFFPVGNGTAGIP